MNAIPSTDFSAIRMMAFNSDWIMEAADEQIADLIRLQLPEKVSGHELFLGWGLIAACAGTAASAQPGSSSARRRA